MKRVLIFSLVYFPIGVGGAEVAIKEITDRIGRDIAEFDMITLRYDKSFPNSEKIGNVRLHRVGFGRKNPEVKDLKKFPLVINKYLYIFAAFLKARRLDKVNNYDMVWAMMANYAGLSAVLFKILYPEKKFLLSLQEGDDFGVLEKKVGIFKFLFDKIFVRADYIQAISNYLAGWAREKKAMGEIKVIPNGVDVEIFKNKADDKRLGELKSKYGINSEDRIIITTSRLVKKNAVGDLIDGFAIAAKTSEVPLRLLICGNGEELESLRQKAAASGFGNKIIFAGHVPFSDLPAYYAISHIFCRPSLSEGLGNSFLEAMAAGLPVIATPVGGIPDFLKDNETGFFCRTNDPGSIADRISQILDEQNSETVSKVRLAAAKMISDKYDWKLVSEEMSNYFN